MTTVQLYDNINHNTETLAEELRTYGYQCTIVHALESTGYDFTILGDLMDFTNDSLIPSGNVICIQSTYNYHHKLASIKYRSQGYFTYPISGNTIATELDKLAYINQNLNPNILLICDAVNRIKYYNTKFEDIIFTLANTPADALAMAPDAHIIICDYTGDDMIDLCIAIRQGNNTPIILLKDHLPVNDHLRLCEAGSIVNLPKFVKYDKLKTAIQTVLRRQRKITNIGIMDDNTGNYTWNSMTTFINYELSRVSRNNSNICLAIVEIDYYHEVDEIHGEFIAQMVLDRLGTLLKDSLRKMDIFCRYNTCKFVILLPNTTSNNALILLNRIRNEWHDIQHHSVVSDFNLTISGAVVQYANKMTGIQFIESMFTALEHNKLKGRNRIGGEKIIDHHRDGL